MRVSIERIEAILAMMMRHQDAKPPRIVVIAVASLIGDEEPLQIFCEQLVDESSATWRVIGLVGTGSIFAVEASINEEDWDYEHYLDGQHPPVTEFSAKVRRTSDIQALALTKATSYNAGHKNTLWEIANAWEIQWRDGSPTIAFPLANTSSPFSDESVDNLADAILKALGS